MCFIGLWLQRPVAASQGNQNRAGRSPYPSPPYPAPPLLHSSAAWEACATEVCQPQSHTSTKWNNKCHKHMQPHPYSAVLKSARGVGGGGGVVGGGTLEGSARHLSTRRSLSPLSHQGVWGNFGLILLTLFNDVDVVKAPVLWGCESESHQEICSIKSAQKN